MIGYPLLLINNSINSVPNSILSGQIIFYVKWYLKSDVDQEFELQKGMIFTAFHRSPYVLFSFSIMRKVDQVLVIMFQNENQEIVIG